MVDCRIIFFFYYIKDKTIFYINNNCLIIYFHQIGYNNYHFILDNSLSRDKSNAILS